MTERERDCLVTTMGALAGAVASYLLFTDRGSALRRQIVPTLEEFERELIHFRGAIARSAGLVREGWKLLNETAGLPSGPTKGHSMTNHHSLPS